MESNKCYTDPYGILGLTNTATRAEVKAAFRQLALKNHPDVDPSPTAAARFADIKRAADVILKGQQAVLTSGSRPGAHTGWQAYAHAAADAQHDWRPRSRHTALWFCAATLAGGCGIFYGALRSHEWLSGYTWLSPAEVEGRMRHPTPRRQQLLRLMMEERQVQQQQQHHQKQGQQAHKPFDRPP